MATTIKLKNSVTTTNAPSSLVQGEVAINITDKKVWVGNAATTPIQLLGDGGSVNFTTVDTTNLQVTNIKAKDGTASATIANSTGVMTIASSVLTTTDINGGTIDGTAIGGSTAAAGAFTTLSASGVATFSAGTVSAPAITTTGDTNTGIFFPAADTIAFTEGGVESMRIDSSGNVGIGTSSPATLLDVSGTVSRIIDVNSTAAGGPQIRFRRSGTNNGYVGSAANIVSGGALADFAIDASGANNLILATNDTERMRITSTGNVGIGTSSPNALLNISSSAQEQLRLSRTTAGSSGYLTFYANNSSSAQVQYAGILGDVVSSTAGSHGGALLFYTTGAATSAERMRINSSGNVGIGTTSPLGKVDASWGGRTAGQVPAILVGANSDSTTRSNDTQKMGVIGAAHYTNAQSPVGLISSNSYASNNDVYVGGGFAGSTAATSVSFWTAANATTTQGTERMRIDSSGRVLVGLTSANTSGANFQVSSGVTFPATQSASSDANTLDDYEEGTWTPTQGAGLTVVGAFSSSGTYTKVGRQVTITGFVAGATSVSVTSLGAICGGLPFTIGSVSSTGSSWTSAPAVSAAYISISTNNLISVEAIAASTNINFTVTYFV
jgi:hypothetical protein